MNIKTTRPAPTLPLLKYFDVKTLFFQSPQDFHVSVGLFSNSFCLVIKGKVTVSCPQGTITAQDGDLIFWPEGVPYQSHWESDDGIIRFIGVYFHTNHYHLSATGVSQLVPTSAYNRFFVFSGKPYKKVIKQMSYDFNTPGREEMAICGFYQCYSSIANLLPRLPAPHPIVHMVHVFVNENWDRDFTINEIAAYCNLSKSHLYHLFKEQTGISLIQYKLQIKTKHAADVLLKTSDSIESISNMLHYSSPAYFCKIFKKQTGMSPTDYRKAGGINM